MKEIFIAIKKFLTDRFNLNDDKADEKEIIESIKKDVNFKGPNLWTLIFAIFIASIGLNINSTAVVIGAMLISPLMGPIMGIGLAVGTNDFYLLQKGIKNFGIAIFISIVTSALYFSITPLHDANSELLARTNPSLWDVFIAFFGGLAGIVAGTRTKRNNVIPGVAIATALMPPLCTVGFGIAIGNWTYLLEAFYLFFINSMLICVATFLVVRHLKFHKAEFQSPVIERRLIRYIWIIVIVTVVPSIYLAYKIVERSIFESNAKNFVQKEFSLGKNQVVNKNYKMDGTNKSIELLLVGNELSREKIDSLKQRLPYYDLEGTKLVIHQGLNANREIDIAQIRASVLENVFSDQNQLDTFVVVPRKADLSIPDLRLELKSLYPELKSYTLSQSVSYNLDKDGLDTITLFTGDFRGRVSTGNRSRLGNWMKQRLKTDSLKIFIK